MTNEFKTMVEKVQAYAPQFADIGVESIQMIIDDTYDTVIADKLPDKYKELGNRLLTCHVLFLNRLAQSGGVQSASMLGESQTMFDWSNDNDPYFNLYQDLLDRFGKSRRKGMAMSFD